MNEYTLEEIAEIDDERWGNEDLDSKITYIEACKKAGVPVGEGDRFNED